MSVCCFSVRIEEPNITTSAAVLPDSFSHCNKIIRQSSPAPENDALFIDRLIFIGSFDAVKFTSANVLLLRAITLHYSIYNSSYDVNLPRKNIIS